MIIFAVYFISSDGRIVLSEIFQNNENLPNEYILSGLLTGFNTISRELTGQYPETLVMGEVSYHFENFSDYYIVLVTDERKSPEDLLFSLGMKFSSAHGHELEEWNGHLDIFYSFIPTLFDEISKHSNFDEEGTIDPNNRLDAGELALLPKTLKPIALILLQHEEIPLSKLWMEVNEDRDKDEVIALFEIREILNELQEMGYVGQKQEDGELLYFI